MQHLLQEGKIKKEKPEIKMSKENNYRSIFHKLALHMSEKKTTCQNNHGNRCVKQADNITNHYWISAIKAAVLGFSLSVL